MNLEAIVLSKLHLRDKPMGFPCSSVSKESAYSAGDPGSIPGSGRSPAAGNVNPFQYSCLENPMDWDSLVSLAGHKSWAQMSDMHTHTHTHTKDKHC